MRYAAKRLLQLAPILLVITFLSFALMHAAGSDVVLQKMEATGMAVSPEALLEARRSLGLDRPFWEQYLSWLGRLLCGDMGTT